MTAARLITATTGFIWCRYRPGQNFLGEFRSLGKKFPPKGAWIKPFFTRWTRQHHTLGWCKWTSAAHSRTWLEHVLCSLRSVLFFCDRKKGETLYFRPYLQYKWQILKILSRPRKPAQHTVCNFSIWKVTDVYKKAVLWYRKTARCRCKIRHVLKFTVASRGSSCHSTALVTSPTSCGTVQYHASV